MPNDLDIALLAQPMTQTSSSFFRRPHLPLLRAPGATAATNSPARGNPDDATSSAACDVSSSAAAPPCRRRPSALRHAEGPPIATDAETSSNVAELGDEATPPAAEQLGTSAPASGSRVDATPASAAPSTCAVAVTTGTPAAVPLNVMPTSSPSASPPQQPQPSLALTRALPVLRGPSPSAMLSYPLPLALHASATFSPTSVTSSYVASLPLAPGSTPRRRSVPPAPQRPTALTASPPSLPPPPPVPLPPPPPAPGVPSLLQLARPPVAAASLAALASAHYHPESGGLTAATTGGTATRSDEAGRRSVATQAAGGGGPVTGHALLGPRGNGPPLWPMPAAAPPLRRLRVNLPPPAAPSGSNGSSNSNSNDTGRSGGDPLHSSDSGKADSRGMDAGHAAKRERAAGAVAAGSADQQGTLGARRSGGGACNMGSSHANGGGGGCSAAVRPLDLTLVATRSGPAAAATRDRALPAATMTASPAASTGPPTTAHPRVAPAGPSAAAQNSMPACGITLPNDAPSAAPALLLPHRQRIAHTPSPQPLLPTRHHVSPPPPRRPPHFHDGAAVGSPPPDVVPASTASIHGSYTSPWVQHSFLPHAVSMAAALPAPLLSSTAAPARALSPWPTSTRAGATLRTLPDDELTAAVAVALPAPPPAPSPASPPLLSPAPSPSPVPAGDAIPAALRALKLPPGLTPVPLAQVLAPVLQAPPRAPRSPCIPGESAQAAATPSPTSPRHTPPLASESTTAPIPLVPSPSRALTPPPPLSPPPSPVAPRTPASARSIAPAAVRAGRATTMPPIAPSSKEGERVGPPCTTTATGAELSRPRRVPVTTTTNATTPSVAVAGDTAVAMPRLLLPGCPGTASLLVDAPRRPSVGLPSSGSGAAPISPRLPLPSLAVPPQAPTPASTPATTPGTSPRVSPRQLTPRSQSDHRDLPPSAAALAAALSAVTRAVPPPPPPPQQPTQPVPHQSPRLLAADQSALSFGQVDPPSEELPQGGRRAASLAHGEGTRTRHAACPRLPSLRESLGVDARCRRGANERSPTRRRTLITARDQAAAPTAPAEEKGVTSGSSGADDDAADSGSSEAPSMHGNQSSCRVEKPPQARNDGGRTGEGGTGCDGGAAAHMTIPPDEAQPGGSPQDPGSAGSDHLRASVNHQAAGTNSGSASPGHSVACHRHRHRRRRYRAPNSPHAPNGAAVSPAASAATSRTARSSTARARLASASPSSSECTSHAGITATARGSGRTVLPVPQQCPSRAARAALLAADDLGGRAAGKGEPTGRSGDDQAPLLGGCLSAAHLEV